MPINPAAQIPVPYTNVAPRSSGARPRNPHARAKHKIGFIWQFLIIGYSTFGKSFAYLGVSPLFIGEAYLGFSVLRNRGKWLSRFVDGCLRRGCCR